MLEYDEVGYRSGIRPFSEFAVSQKNRKVRSWSSRTNGSRSGARSLAVSRSTVRASPAGASTAERTMGSCTSCAAAPAEAVTRSKTTGAIVRITLGSWGIVTLIEGESRSGIFARLGQWRREKGPRRPAPCPTSGRTFSECLFTLQSLVDLE